MRGIQRVASPSAAAKVRAQNIRAPHNFDFVFVQAKRFILFHGKRHPAQTDKAEVTAFLTHLAVQRNVAASTRNQALSAILFLYRDVLELELGWVEGFERPKRPARLPVVLTPAEARAVLAQLEGT